MEELTLALELASSFTSPKGQSWRPKLNSLATTQTHILSFGLVHPNIYPIFDLECVKELAGPTDDNYRVSMTRQQQDM